MNNDLLIIVMPIVVALIAAIAVMWGKKRDKKVRVVDLTSQSTAETSAAFWVDKFKEVSESFGSMEKSLSEIKLKQDLIMALLQGRKGN